MKKIRQLCACLILALVVTLSAFAGDIPFPGVTNSPPPPPQSLVADDTDTTGATVTGETPAPVVVTLDPMTEAALSLLQSILSLF
jgi:hypothetical protein